MIALRRLRWPSLAFLVLAPVLVAGCNGSPVSPTNFAAFSQTDLVVGVGATAVAGKSVTVHYTGWLYDPSKPENKGLQFETSIGSTPFTFTLGAGAVISGWDKGVVGMNVGGKRRLVLPPSDPLRS